MRRLFVLAALCFAVPAHAVTIEWVEVGDPGNPCDVQSQGCFGSVGYTYKIGKYEVTNAQYADFLNAVAEADPFSLYDTSMGIGWGAGITRSGSPGSYSYSTVAGRERKPVTSVTFFDALRFANWLHNGQGSGDTETGAYALLGGAPLPSNWVTVTRNADATIFLTSEDEWYKAAYYDPISMSYFKYPMGTNELPLCSKPVGDRNAANCYWFAEDFTDVGSYRKATSPYGTFDQGGNVWELNEAVIGSNPPKRGMRGGSYGAYSFNMLSASERYDQGTANCNGSTGFRVAMIPEPATALLLAGGLLGLTLRRRLSA